MDAIAENFIKDADIDFINECNIGKLTCIIKNLLKKVSTYEDWIDNKGKILEKISNYRF